MPTYELSIILRQMTRPEVASTLKRTAEAILERGGIIRAIENLGNQKLPHKISAHGIPHRIGSYFLMKFDTPPSAIIDLKEEYGRDVDIIRRNIFRIKDEEEFKQLSNIECTLSDELQPPAYRKNVKKMIEIGQQYKKTKYPYNSGFDYYPFQK